MQDVSHAAGGPDVRPDFRGTCPAITVSLPAVSILYFPRIIGSKSEVKAERRLLVDGLNKENAPAASIPSIQGGRKRNWTSLFPLSPAFSYCSEGKPKIWIL